MLNEGRTAFEAYKLILSQFYHIEEPTDVRICCQNSLFTGHSEASAFPQDIGSPEDLIPSVDYNPMSQVMDVESYDDIGEDDIDDNIHAVPEFDDELEVPYSNDPDIEIRGFRLDKNGNPILVDVGMGLKVKILDTNTDIFR